MCVCYHYSLLIVEVIVATPRTINKTHLSPLSLRLSPLWTTTVMTSTYNTSCKTNTTATRKFGFTMEALSALSPSLQEPEFRAKLSVMVKIFDKKIRVRKGSTGHTRPRVAIRISYVNTDPKTAPQPHLYPSPCSCYPKQLIMRRRYAFVRGSDSSRTPVCHTLSSCTSQKPRLDTSRSFAL